MNYKIRCTKISTKGSPYVDGNLANKLFRRKDINRFKLLTIAENDISLDSYNKTNSEKLIFV